MYPIDLSGKTGIVFGVANGRSIAWAIARTLHQAGARLAMAYQNERVKGNVAKLVSDWEDSPLIECDVSSEDNVAAAFDRAGAELGRLDFIVHSIAFANRDDLGGRFVDTGRDGFRLALDISAYSLVSIARHGSPLMTDGGSIQTLTFQASERVFPGYNVMGTAKAALENVVKQLASDLGLRRRAGQRHLGRPARHPVVEGHQPIPRHEAGARRALADGPQHHPRRGGQGGTLPGERPLLRHHRRDPPRRHRLQHHGHLAVETRC